MFHWTRVSIHESLPSRQSIMFARRFFSSTALRVPDRVPLDWFRANQSKVKVVDGTWLMKESALLRHKASRIPGSVFFDIDACVGDGGAHNLPHMLPTEAAFSAYAGAKLGLSESDPIVIYDSERSAFSAPRVWWTLRVFGAKNIGILDGGLQEYIKHNLPTHGTAQPLATPAPAKFTAKLDHGLIKAWSDVQANISTQACTVVDARNAGRFAGTAPEPRPHLAGGHIPKSVNVPSDTLLDTSTGLFKTDAQLRQLFASVGVDVNSNGKPVIASCGSGVTACVVLYGLHILGKKNIALYDGSWSEWGVPAMKLPVATGK